ncbi:MAG: membrane protein insertase YidC, partial [Candidatus Marinimicrobia bacterium]|nr:membrane protein insertase YidC [Candidatus Neomarinimicrobiota bacterium]
MSDSARAFLAFALIAVVLILTPRYLKILSPPKQQEAPPPAGQESIVLPGDKTTTPIADAPKSAPAIKEKRPSFKEATLPEKWFTVETPLYIARLSSRAGGHIETFELKNYPSRRYAGNVQLVPETNHANLAISFINLDGDSTILNEPFEVVKSPARSDIYLEEGTAVFRFQYRFPAGAQVTKEITFNADSYLLGMDISWQRPELVMGINQFEIGWSSGLQPAEQTLSEDEQYGKVFVYQGGELEEQGSVKKNGVKRENFKGATDWVAMRNKYFCAAFIADGTDAIYGAFSAEPIPQGAKRNGRDSITRYKMSIGYGVDGPAQLNIFLGPLSYYLIKDLDVDLDRIMNFGFTLIRPISKGVLFSLVSMHKIIPNYGIVLILFAVIIRVVTNPLTKKSFASTQKMQLVQPKVKELQEKYKGNSQKLNQEMMALWKKEGVNPLGGCLPILIQMPLLFALFIVFRTTIELRGAPFFLWVKDLSMPDVVFTLPFSIPLYGDGVTILALVMGISMFIQQRLSGAASNPQQKPMMYMMTAMFFLLFNR